MAAKDTEYLHGHHESVLRSHSWRTVENSAKHIIPYFKKDSAILDVGSGPGTISIDFLKYAPQGKVVGIDASADVVQQAQNSAAEQGVSDQVSFKVGDIYKLDFPDASFDIVHAHQVLQHIDNPVKALKEMRRVAKPGGIVAVRESDYSSITWYPHHPGLVEWRELYLKAARAVGGEPDAGRKLHVWAREAGYDRKHLDSGAGTWCFSTPEEIQWWTSMWADRILASSFAKKVIDGGFADENKLKELSNVWTEFGKEEDAWFVFLHGEIIYHV